jgi:CheY-like chemotaxis protein
MPLLPKAQDITTRVLIVDDNNYNLDICNEYVTSGGYDAICADGGVSGMQYLQQHGGDVDLILLDRKMPQMDGIQMLSHLQADSVFREIPVIVVTAEIDQKMLIAGKKAGVCSYVTKPFTRREMLTAIDSALGSSYRKSAAK